MSRSSMSRNVLHDLVFGFSGYSKAAVRAGVFAVE
jgi:hypothetical protein